MSAPTCCGCDRGLEAGPLYRVNPLGVVPAVWAHLDCLTWEPDSETVRLCEVIAGAGEAREP